MINLVCRIRIMQSPKEMMIIVFNLVKPISCYVIDQTKLDIVIVI